MRDLGAVMDEVGSQRAAIVGLSEGAPLAIAFAAAQPERVTHLVVYGPLPCAARKEDYPWAEPAEWWEEVIERFERMWGEPEYMRADVAWRAPSEQDNDAFVQWWGQYRRLGASPGAAADLARMNSLIDVRRLLPTIRVPTTVIHRVGDKVISPEHGRYVARTVPGARYIELPGEDHLPFTGDAAALIDAIAGALGAEAPAPSRAPRIRTEPHFNGTATAQLSSRELEIMRWVARGKSNQQIAIALYVTESTVRKHLQNIYRKLNVPSRTAALALLNGTLVETANGSI